MKRTLNTLHAATVKASKPAPSFTSTGAVAFAQAGRLQHVAAMLQRGYKPSVIAKGYHADGGLLNCTGKRFVSLKTIENYVGHVKNELALKRVKF